MSKRSQGGCPPDVLEWIAWYPDGGLSDAERGAVEAHAATCEACREELAVLAGRREPPAGPRDPERLFARVLTLIESEGTGREPRPRIRPEAVPEAEVPTLVVPEHRAPPRRARGRRVASWLAAAASLAVALGLGWLAHDRLGTEPIYRSASAPPVAAPGDGLALDVVFRNDASAQQINTELRGLGAVIVSGPTQVGRYRIELPTGSDPIAAAALLSAEDAGVASYAEPARP